MADISLDTAMATGASVPMTEADRYGIWITVNDFGAKGDGINDDTAPIQGAINAVANRGGGDVRLPAGVYLISATLVIQAESVRLAGAGVGGWHDSSPGITAATTLRWIGPTGGTMISVAPAPGSYQALRGCGVMGAYLDPGAGCAVGVSVVSSSNGVYEVTGNDFSASLMTLGCSSMLSEAADTQQNEITLSSRNLLNAGHAVILDGTATANTCFNTFRSIKGVYKDGDLIVMRNCDNNLIVSVQAYRVPGGVGYGVVLEGHANNYAQVCRNNMFLDVSPGSGRVYAHGSEIDAVPSGPNTIHAYDKGNGPPDPAIGAGAVLYWASNTSPIGKRRWSQSTSANRFYEIDSAGHIRQSGVAGPLAPGATSTITLPVPLTTAATLVLATPTDALGTFAAIANTTALTITNGAASANSFYWLVEGY